MPQSTIPVIETEMSVELQKQILEEITDNETLDGSALEPERQLSQAAEGIAGNGADSSPSERVYDVLEEGHNPVRAFYTLGAKTRNSIEQSVNPDSLEDAYIEEMAKQVVNKVHENRKGSIEKAAETFDFIGLSYDMGKAALKARNRDEDMNTVFMNDRLNSENTNVYGVKGEYLVEAFREGYRQRSGQTGYQNDFFREEDAVRASD